MAVRVEGVLAAPERALPWLRLGARRAILLVALAAGGLFALGLGSPAFYDNEGRYAEVAREMVLSRDWVTPHLDYWPFLNKPPLLFWMAAGVFQLAGPTEWARIVSVLAAVAALVATGRLGALLYGETTGLVATLALATTMGFVLEARTLRPDMVMTAAIVVALLCWTHARKPDARRRSAWLAGFYAALGVGVLAKGLVAGVVVALPVAVVTFRDDGWAGVRALRPGLGLAIMGALVVPWHVLVALRHPGFAWDYVVNQHILFAFDKKFPRDSIGDSLRTFWGAYAARTFPWVLLLPLSLGEAVRGFRPRAAADARATAFLAAWAGGLLLFFSATPSRLEHYAFPALPPSALLAARTWQRARRGELGRAGWLSIAAAGGVLVLAAVVGVLRGAGLLERIYWIAQAPGLAALVRPASIAAAGAGLLLVVGALRRRAAVVALALAATTALLGPIVVRAHVEVSPLFSWRGAAEAIRADAPAATEVVFEAPEEYQLVGGLAYYLGRPITLLEPPGWIPPTYLECQSEAMFLRRAEFERRWRSDAPLALVSDPLQRRDQPAGLVPEPFRVVARFGDRWVLVNAAALLGR